MTELIRKLQESFWNIQKYFSTHENHEDQIFGLEQIPKKKVILIYTPENVNLQPNDFKKVKIGRAHV